MKKIISLVLVLLMLALVGCSNQQSYKGETYKYVDEENIVHTFTEISSTKIKESVNGREDVEYVFSIAVEEGNEVLSLYITGQLKWKFIISNDKTLTIFEGQHTHNFVDGSCSCGEKDPNYVKEKEVDILSLSGTMVNTSELQKVNYAEETQTFKRLKSSSVVKLTEEDKEENNRIGNQIIGGFGGHKDYDKDGDGISDYAQYVVMYKSEKHINFTISLDNPKGHSIDAVQLTCDDPNAKIQIFNSDGTFTWELLSQAKDGYVINWASENAYRKTYYLETTAPDAINTLKVVDLKVNGEWQNQALDNDELKIYKMEDEDLSWEFVTNTLAVYKWRMNKSENISDLKVYADGEEVVADENGVYSVEKDCVVEFEYEYTRDGVTAKWNDSREIELLGLHEYTNSQAYICLSTQFKFFFNKGTDIDLENYQIEINNVIYNFEIYKRLDGQNFIISTFELPVERIDTVDLETKKDYLETIFVIIGEEKISMYEIMKNRKCK